MELSFNFKKLKLLSDKIIVYENSNLKTIQYPALDILNEHNVEN